MNQRKPPADPTRAARMRARAEYEAGLAALRAAPPAVPTRSPRTARAAKAPANADRIARAIEALGVHGKLLATSYGPLRVDQALGPAQPKGQRIESPTWLAIVRCLPCACCNAGRSFTESLLLVRAAGDWKAGAQSEANHHPAKGRGGGGSDFLTHPACSRCHRVITENKRSSTAPPLRMLVADTHSEIALAIASGAMQIAILVACAIEALANAER